MVNMINEFSATGKVRFGITHGNSFLFKFIEECAKNSDWIDISTFSLNLAYTESGSIARKLFDLREKKENAGNKLDIRIICGIPTRLDDVLDEIPITENSILTYIGDYTLNAIVYQLYHEKNDLNHSKMILSENLAYIGSLNFGSSKSYETGIIIEDSNIIRKIRTDLFDHLVSKSERMA